MNRKKVILVAIVLALLLLIGSMLAYFTDTESKTNNFTLGEKKIDIILTETLWDNLPDADGDHIPDAAEDIIPGATITKDPQIKNNSTTNSVCVFAKVIVPAVSQNKEIFTYTIDSTKWVEVGTPEYDSDEGTVTHVYAYGSAQEMTELESGVTTEKVFASVTVNSALTEADLQNIESSQQIDIEAHGIQYDNLESYVPADVLDLIS